MNFDPNTRVARIANAAVAAQTDVVSSVVDTVGFQGVVVAALLGEVTATSELQLIVEHGDLADGSDAVATDAATTQHVATGTDADNKVLIVEAHKPMKRYLRARLKRAAANAAVDGIVAIQTGPTYAPASHDPATVLASKFSLHPETA